MKQDREVGHSYYVNAYETNDGLKAFPLCGKFEDINANSRAIFRDDDDTDRFKDNTENVEAEWNSVVLDLNNLAHKKNIKRVSLSSNPTNSQLTIGYRLKGGDKQVLTKIYTNKI